MQKKYIPKLIGILMLISAVGFMAFALANPQASFPWSNSVTYTVYILYLVLTGALLKK